MNRIKRSFAALFLIAVLLLCSFSAFSAEVPCSLTLYTETEGKVPIEGFKISLCRIADRQGEDYILTAPFSHSNLSVETLIRELRASHAKQVLSYLREQNISYLRQESDAAGNTTFSSLEQGLYLVFCEDGQEYLFNPYLLLLPAALGGETVYDLNGSPKIEQNTAATRTVTVTKQWADPQKEHPQEIRATLLCNGTPYETFSLTAESGWTKSFPNLPADGAYTVTEEKIPHYEAAYSGNDRDGLVITNTYYRLIPPSLVPDTGDGSAPLLWGLLLMASALVLMTLFILRKKKA